MHLKQCYLTLWTKFAFHILYKPEWDFRCLILFWFVTKSCLVFDVFCQRLAKLNILLKILTLWITFVPAVNFKVYHDPKYRYRFGMTELNYDTRMCEYGLHSYKIQFAGKSEYTSLCMLVLNQRWRKVCTNQKFASLVCSPTHRT